MLLLECSYTENMLIHIPLLRPATQIYYVALVFVIHQTQGPFEGPSTSP